MKEARRADLAFAAAVCGGIGLYDLAYLAFSVFGGPSIGPINQVAFPDFLVFYGAVHAFVEGKLALLYDVSAFSSYQSTLFADRFPHPLTFRPFLYPPLWLLMLLPLALLGVAAAYALFMAVTAAIATTLEGRRDWWGWLAVLVSPASVWVLMAGQNTFLSLGLLYGGLRRLERSPAAAGVLLGLLAYKPQLWALVPLALLAARQWRALAWMLATVALLCLASLALFGAGVWRDFTQLAFAGSSRIAGEMFDRIYMQMMTLVAAARIVGLPGDVGAIVQFAGATAAVAAVWYAFRYYCPSDARTAVLVTATLLISPYTLNYELLLVMPAIVVLFRQAAAKGFMPLERSAYLLVWLAPTAGWLLNQSGVPIVPFVLLALGVLALLRLRATA